MGARQDGKPPFRSPPTIGHERDRSAIPKAEWRILGKPDVRSGVRERRGMGRERPICSPCCRAAFSLSACGTCCSMTPPTLEFLATLPELEAPANARDMARSRSHRRHHQAAPRSLAHVDKGAQHLLRGPHCNPNKCTRRAAHRGSLAAPVQPPEHSLQRPGQAPKLRRSDRSALRSEGSFLQWARDAVEGDW